jgi:hypothetical protein
MPSKKAGASAPATRSSMTGRCGACHRAHIRATRWHRRENAAPRPGHERICSRRRAVICPSGGFLTGVSSLISDFPKNISVPTHPKSILELSPSRPTEGRFAIVTDVGHGMRWTRQR